MDEVWFGTTQVVNFIYTCTGWTLSRDPKLVFVANYWWTIQYIDLFADSILQIFHIVDQILKVEIHLLPDWLEIWHGYLMTTR